MGLHAQAQSIGEDYRRKNFVPQMSDPIQWAEQAKMVRGTDHYPSFGYAHKIHIYLISFTQRDSEMAFI
jgi:hypothetical protein